jgi:hypothetical protein
VRTNIIYITLSYKRTLRTEVAYTNYLASSLNIFIGKTLVPSSGVPFTYPSVDRKPYYNSSLSLNRSIDLSRNPTVGASIGEPRALAYTSRTAYVSHA